MNAPGFRLFRNAFGRLMIAHGPADAGEPVTPVRAFPIAAPTDGVALVNGEGRELAWIERLADLPAETRALIEETLAAREFMPEIRRIAAVSSFVTPSTWTVETDRGETKFVLEGEEFIRRLAPGTLLIADANGIYYLIRDTKALDAASRKLLDRFL